MKRIFFKYHTGYCGEDGCECLEYPDNITDEELDQDAMTGAYDHACSYGREFCSCDDSDCEEEHDDSGYIDGYWELYDPEKHDMLRPGGGQWFKD